MILSQYLTITLKRWLSSKTNKRRGRLDRQFCSVLSVNKNVSCFLARVLQISLISIYLLIRWYASSECFRLEKYQIVNSTNKKYMTNNVSYECFKLLLSSMVNWSSAQYIEIQLRNYSRFSFLSFQLNIVKLHWCSISVSLFLLSYFACHSGHCTHFENEWQTVDTKTKTKTFYQMLIHLHYHHIESNAIIQTARKWIKIRQHLNQRNA